ncbi:MAG: MBL fold metallo-hydrolase [Pirellulales bacterium]|nr:MBL fold metallo-hydrolase [Pirellulales bacterium]
MLDPITEPAKTRREFLHRAAVGAACLAAATGESRAAERVAEVAVAKAAKLTRLSEHLAVYHGPINVGIVRHGDRALLIDCGDGSVVEALPEPDLKAIEQVIFTHHHRDQACGAHALAAAGARLGVPAAERDYFDNVGAYWTDPKSRWHLYNQHPHHLMLAESVRVDATFGQGDQWAWGPAKIQVLATPGHTDGSISYVVEVDGKRVVFCGDAIYDAGQVWEIHSLQKGTQTTDYHGFLGAREQLVASLGRIRAAQPDALVPSHGNIMHDPPKAIDALAQRLETCYDRYVAISALRHYFPKMFTDYAGREDHMSIRPGKPVPACLRHFGTTWLLVSQDKAALAMDCGSPQVVEELKQLIAQDEIGQVEALWVTHYHDDHVDAIPLLQKTFDCPCITDRFVAGVITDPLAWRLPCISPSKARVDRATEDGQSWQWHEFKLTAYHFPGQTLYHAGLLAEGRGLRMLFVGDSFTMGGIDDYCAHNRNWLGRDVGFDRCLALIEELRPTHIFNCHVDTAFDFTAEQVRFMRANLAEREKRFGRLVPWDHPNYGTDEPWVRCHPYEQKAAAGNRVSFDVVVTNHSTEPRAASARAVSPRAIGGCVGDWVRAEVPQKSDGRLRLSLAVPPDAKPGRYVIAVDVRYGGRSLPQFSEAIVVV